MMVHYCAGCGERSWHGPGSIHFALVCPHCGLVDRQHPHAPPRPPRQHTPVHHVAEAVGVITIGAAAKPTRKRAAKKATGRSRSS